MSFNSTFASLRHLPNTKFDPEPHARRPFEPGFNIFDDDADDDSPLSTLASSLHEVPTQYQVTNKDSVTVAAEPRPAIATPFDSSWIKWEARSQLIGYNVLVRHKRTTTWW